MRVVICGGGVIGACTAYFLSLRQVEVIVVERTGVACAASGKSGGFLALDWCDGSALGRLARRSFALHAELAARLDGSRWGYRRLDTWSVLAGARRGLGGGRAVSGPAWLGESALVQGKLGTPATTAQVHPARFTEAMLQAAIGMGAQLQLGCVTDVVLDAGRTTAVGVEVDGEVLEADAVVIAMGPWSMSACRWLPLAGGVRAQGQQRGVPERQRDLGRRAVRRAHDRATARRIRRRCSRAPTARPTSAACPASRHCRTTLPTWRPTRGRRRRCGR